LLQEVYDITEEEEGKMQKRLYDRVEWPNKAKVALSIVFNIEAWSSPLSALPVYSAFPSNAKTQSDSNVVNDREYAQKVGLWRLLDILDHYKIKMTAVVSGLAAERYPKMVKEIGERGHEIAGHSYDQTKHLITLGPEEEKEDIRKTISAIEKVIHKKPLGWMSQSARCTERTAELLVESGMIWHSDYLDDDLPYFIRKNEKKLLAIPYDCFMCNDLPIYIKQQQSPKEALGLLIYQFDALYEEGEKYPKMMSYGIHPFITGRPGRAKAFREFIEYVTKLPRVWVAKRIEIADWWSENYSK
jgi:allantoinase